MDTQNADLILAQKLVERCLEASVSEWEGLIAEFKSLDSEARIRCWSMVTMTTQNDGAPWTRAKAIHAKLASLVLEVFGVPMGKSGVGVFPTGAVAERMMAEEKIRKKP